MVFLLQRLADCARPTRGRLSPKQVIDKDFKNWSGPLFHGRITVMKEEVRHVQTEVAMPDGISLADYRVASRRLDASALA